MTKPKLVITGCGQHGKDTVCEILKEEYGFTFESSSQLANKLVIYNQLKEYYSSLEDCFKDRRNWRILWHQLICRYNTPDKTRLAKAIFKDHDIYCGLRNIEEFNQAKKENLIDVSIWVDASFRKPLEYDSISIKQINCDYVLDNNGTLEELRTNIKILMKQIL